MKIVDVKAWPLSVPVKPDEQKTSAGNFPMVSIVVVEVVTDAGITGWGESLLRFGPQAGATLIETLLKPKLVGQDPLAIDRHWQAMFRTFSGRSGGVLIEAMAGVDIALWDILGKATGRSISTLLGGMGRQEVAAYASSITWGPLAVAERQVEEAIARGFPLIKAKFGAPVGAAMERARALASIAAGRVKLCCDVNWALDYDDAVTLARALVDLDYYWLEEPFVPEDLEGYRRLRAAVPIRLAAGESEFTAFGARDLIAARAVGVIQPDCARSGGITETRRIAGLAHAFHVPYAPHIGFSGAICVAASLHLAAAMPNFLTFECMIFDNPLRDTLATTKVGDPATLRNGCLPVPAGPGLGVDIDRDALRRFAVA